MLTKDELPACPVATTLMLIGNKWKIFIVQRLLDRPWSLTDWYHTRSVYPEVPVRVEYTLSELGNTMRPIISSLFDWGMMYQSLVNSSK